MHPLQQQMHEQPIAPHPAQDRTRTHSRGQNPHEAAKRDMDTRRQASQEAPAQPSAKAGNCPTPCMDQDPPQREMWTPEGRQARRLQLSRAQRLEIAPRPAWTKIPHRERCGHQKAGKAGGTSSAERKGCTLPHALHGPRSTTARGVDTSRQARQEAPAQPSARRCRRLGRAGSPGAG